MNDELMSIDDIAELHKCSRQQPYPMSRWKSMIFAMTS